MNNIKSIALALAAGLLLNGCVQTAPLSPQPDKTAIEAAEIAKYSDVQLCQAADVLQPSLNVNPASHPEYNENLRRSKALDAAARARNLNCYKLKNATVKPTQQLTARQKQARASATCAGHAQRAQFADPTVLQAMCIKGFLATPAKCSTDKGHFNSEANKLKGAARVEYIEIGNAFHVGCNLN
ncbi:hypothetical protein H0K60_004499 [Salmonella enterica]|nr:hypothetical protein [Salmonella enterica]EFR2649741.1 hypothetical protein [Salmonella enterica]EFS1408048.1 hypothetical protein [Salmonella enterica]EHQ8162538.1 hypothetical protein [Salmonella enterica]EJZ9218191.1 hypothetical protein [Salmonella enterica]